MFRYGVSEGALLRHEAGHAPQVWWEGPQEWHVLPEPHAWVSSRPVTPEKARGEFPGVELTGPVTFDPA